ncbi:MAG: hypothetical protein AB8G15_11785 [Saprospiraceae bacterium]
MKNALGLILLLTCSLLSCDTEQLLFEKEVWWHGQWQKQKDTSFYFSVGQKPIGPNAIVTTHFFLSTSDSIRANFHVKNLIDFNWKKRWKIIKTSDDTYLKIRELDTSKIALSGPSPSLVALDSSVTIYVKKADVILLPIVDSLLLIR